MGFFKPNVMLFGLQGAPGMFSHMIVVDMAPMYREFPENRFKHYMDDCLVAMGEGELELHRKMNHQLLQIFEEHSYFLKPSKCIFKQPEVDFLGVHLGHGKTSINPSKIAGIKCYSYGRLQRVLHKLSGSTKVRASDHAWEGWGHTHFFVFGRSYYGFYTSNLHQHI